MNAQLPSSLQKAAIERARLYGVTPNIHSDDHIFNFLIGNPVFQEKSHAIPIISMTAPNQPVN